MDNISSPVISKMHRRLTLFENMHHEWIEDLVATLKTIPSYENAIISSPDGPFTVAELVDDIQKLRLGWVYEYIRLWRRTLVTLSKGRKSVGFLLG